MFAHRLRRWTNIGSMSRVYWVIRPVTRNYIDMPQRCTITSGLTGNTIADRQTDRIVYLCLTPITYTIIQYHKQ